MPTRARTPEKMMDESQRLSVFNAQTENVRELKRAWTHINRQINSSLLKGDKVATVIQTKVLAVVYCALAEATFSKIIHTPHGLTLDEIEQIKKCSNADGVKSGWTKCAELAISRVDGGSSGYVPNVLRKLSSLIQEFIYDPSLLRNKLAHGQWSVALNRENTAVNSEITREIEGCTIIDLYRREHALERLGAIIEDMIESPNRAHRRDYWVHLTKLEEGERVISKWTLERKIEQLQKKKAFQKHETGSVPA